MGNNFDNYNYMNEQYRQKYAKMLEFFEIVKFFQNSGSAEKRAFVEKYWGDIKTTEKFLFGDNCSITISKDANGKYNAEFNYENGSFEEFKKMMPEMAEDLKGKTTEEIRKKYPEINDYNCPEDVYLDKSVLDMDKDYLSAYNNINFSDDKKNE